MAQPQGRKVKEFAVYYLTEFKYMGDSVGSGWVMQTEVHSLPEALDYVRSRVDAGTPLNDLKVFRTVPISSEINIQA